MARGVQDLHGGPWQDHVEAARDAERRVVEGSGFWLGLTVAYTYADGTASEIGDDLVARIGRSGFDMSVLFEDPDDLGAGVNNVLLHFSHRTGVLLAVGSPSGQRHEQ